MASRKKKAKARTWRSSARGSREAEEVAKRLGDRLAKLRESRRLTQEVVAGKAQLDAKHYQAIEHGKTNPTLATLTGIAGAFGLTLSGLLKGV